MITLTLLCGLAMAIIAIGFICALFALLFLNWGPGAAYDYTGNKMLRRKRKRARAAQRRR